MSDAEQTMINNLYKNTGKRLEEWIAIVQRQKFEKHGQIMKFLKEQYAFSHGFANLVALKARSADSGSVDDKTELIDRQYKGKEHFRPLYEKLLKETMKFGKDIEIAPKNAYVSLRRKKQFAIFQPATKTRYEIGINLKGQAPKGKLVGVTAKNAMCSHKINLSDIHEIDQEVLDWIKLAYDHAG